MTDFLSRLAVRITAPESGLRPNAPTRFEPTPGLGSEAGPFEVNEEREVRAPPQRRSVTAALGPMPQQAQPAPTPAATPAVSPSVRARSADGARSADASSPVPDTLAVMQTKQTGSTPRAEPATEPPSSYHSQARAPAERADPASPPQPATLQPATSTHRVEHHRHDERVIERVVTAADEQAVGQDRPVAPPAVGSADDQGTRPRRPVEPEPQPPQQIRQTRQTAPQYPAPPLREPVRTGREPHPEPPQPAPVVVRIDRLEVRVAPPRVAAPAAASRPTQPVTDLDRYLAGLEGRRS